MKAVKLATDLVGAIVLCAILVVLINQSLTFRAWKEFGVLPPFSTFDLETANQKVESLAEEWERALSFYEIFSKESLKEPYGEILGPVEESFFQEYLEAGRRYHKAQSLFNEIKR